MKILFYSDVHLREYGSAVIYNILDSNGLTKELNNLLKGLKFVHDKILAIEPDLVINGGDVYHTLETISHRTLFASSIGLGWVKDACDKVDTPHIILRGNHDTLAETPQIISSISNLVGYGKIITECEYYTHKDFEIKFVPHFSNNGFIYNELMTAASRSNLIITHLDFIGAKYENNMEVDRGIAPDLIDIPIISGHIHVHQTVGNNVTYIGGLTQTKFYKIPPGGILVYDTDTSEIEFIENSYSKHYFLVTDLSTLSELDPKRVILKISTTMPREEVEVLAKDFEFVYRKEIQQRTTTTIYTNYKIEDPKCLLRGHISKEDPTVLDTYDRVIKREKRTT